MITVRPFRRRSRSMSCTAFEKNPPAGEAPLEWRLITTEPIASREQVVQILEWYRTRWLIEEFFKCLKTGCV